jgi:tRNA-specific 2-thiouridylase
MFPVGEFSKDDVRRMALERGMRVADKPDSQEICFVPDGDYAAVVDRLRPRDRSGLIIDAGGRVTGRHDGTHRFTIGQRKGLPAGGREPLFVVGIDAARRVVTVGPREALRRTTLEASRVNWIAGDPPAGPLRVEAQIRHRHRPAPAVAEPLDRGRARVVFDAPQEAITPGQSVVFYQGDEVLGGGWID